MALRAFAALRIQRLPRVQKATRSLGMSTRGAESGALVRSSKNGFGRPNPRAHQPSSFDPGEYPERRWRRRVRRKRRDGRALVDAAQRRTNNLIAGTALGLVAHEGMNETQNREARRGGGVGNRCVAAIGVPAEDLVGETQRPHGIGACGQLHASRRHLKNVGAARRVEHIRPFEKTRVRLAVLAVADEAKAGGRRNIVRGAPHMAATAAKRKVEGHAHIVRRVSRRRNPSNVRIEPFRHGGTCRGQDG